MNETQLKELLTRADQALWTDSPADSAALIHHVQQRVAIHKRRRAELLAGGTLVLLLAACLVGYTQFNRYQEKKQVVLQAEVQNELTALKAETEQTLALIKSVNQRSRQRKQLTALQRRLASLTAERNDADMQDEQLAGKLYFKAQTLSKQTDSCNTVKSLYQQIIQTFPNSSYTPEAKEELAQLDCSNGIHL